MCPKEEVAAAYAKIEIENHHLDPVNPKFKVRVQHGRVIDSFPKLLKQQKIALSLNPERFPVRFINLSTIVEKLSPWRHDSNPYTTRVLSGPDNQPETNLIVCVPTVADKFSFELTAEGLVKWSHILEDLSLHFITPGGVQIVNDITLKGVQIARTVLSRSIELEAQFFQSEDRVLMEVIDFMRVNVQFFENGGHLLTTAGPLTLMVGELLKNQKAGIIESQARLRAEAQRVVNKGRILSLQAIELISKTSLENFNEIRTVQTLQLNCEQLLSNQGGLYALVTGVNAGKIVQSSKAQLTGVQRVILDSQSEVENAGLFLGENIEITAPIKINNQEGAKIQGESGIQLNSEEVVNAGEINSYRKKTKLSVEIEAGVFKNLGFLKAMNCSIVTSHWVNKGVAVATTLSLEGLEDENRFDNTGTVKTSKLMDLSCRVLKNDGFLESFLDSIHVLEASQIIQGQEGRMTSCQNLRLQAKEIIENQGAIAGRKVSLTTLNPVSSLKNLSTGFMKAEQGMEWITPTAENTGEIVVEAEKFTVKSNQFDNTKTGRVLASHLDIDVAVFDNQGLLGSSRQTNLRAKQLTNRGVITAQAGVAQLCSERTPMLSPVQTSILADLQAGRRLKSPPSLPVPGKVEASKTSGSGSNAGENASESERKVDLEAQQALGHFLEPFLEFLNGSASEADSTPVKRKLAEESIEHYEVNVPGDGTCLFYSVAFAYLLPLVNDKPAFEQRFVTLFGPEVKDAAEENRIRLLDYDGNVEFIQKHQATLEVLVNVNFRSRLVDFMKNNQKELEEFIKTENETFEERMNRMGDPKVKDWGDQPEIEAMSRFLKVNIKVWQDQAGRLVPEAGADHGSNQGYSDKINLVHANRNHYHYLIAALPGRSNQAAEVSAASNLLASESKEGAEKVAQNLPKNPVKNDGVPDSLVTLEAEEWIENISVISGSRVSLKGFEGAKLQRIQNNAGACLSGAEALSLSAVQVENAGEIVCSQICSVTAEKTLKNSGLLSGQAITLNAENIQNTATGKVDGKNIHCKTKELENHGHYTAETLSFLVKKQFINAPGSKIKCQSSKIQAERVVQQGELLVQGTLHMTAQQFVHDRGLMQAGDLDITATKDIVIDAPIKADKVCLTAKDIHIATPLKVGNLKIVGNNIHITAPIEAEGDIEIFHEGGEWNVSPDMLRTKGKVIIHFQEGRTVEPLKIMGSLRYVLPSSAKEPLRFLADQPVVGDFEVDAPTTPVIIGSDSQYVYLGRDSCSRVDIRAKNVVLPNGCIAGLQGIALDAEAIYLGRLQGPLLKRSALTSGGTIQLTSRGPEPIVWNQIAIQGTADLVVNGSHLDNISSNVIIADNALFNVQSSQHRLLTRYQDLGGVQAHYYSSWSGSNGSYKTLHARHDALTAPACMQIGKKLTHRGQMTVFGSQICYGDREGPAPTLKSFVPYENYTIWILCGHKKVDKCRWYPNNCQDRGTPLMAECSSWIEAQLQAPILTIEGLFSAPGIKISGIERGIVGWSPSYQLSLPAPEPFKAVQTLVQFVQSGSPLFEITGMGSSYPTIYRPILSQLDIPLGRMTVVDRCGNFRPNSDNRRSILSGLQEVEFITKAAFRVLGRGYFLPGLDPRQQLIALKRNAEKLADGRTPALVPKEPFLAYTTCAFEHASKDQEASLEPLIFTPPEYDNPRSRDWAGGLFSSEGISLEGASQASSILILTGHSVASGKMVIRNFDQVSQQRRVVIEKQKVVDTVIESQYMGLKDKKRETEREIEIAKLQPGNSIKAYELEMSNINYLHQMGLNCQIGAGGVHIHDIGTLTQQPLVEVGVELRHSNLGSTESMTQEPKPIPYPVTIDSEGPVSIGADTARIYLQVNGNNIKDGNGPVKARCLTFDQIEEQIEAAQRFRDRMERDARRTYRRKQTQGLVKAGIATALTFYLGPQVGFILGESALLAGNTLAIAAAKGAVMGFMNSVIMEQNPLKGTLKGAMFELFTAGLEKHFDQVKYLQEHEELRKRLTVLTTTTFSTAVQGGDPIKNMLIAFAAHEIAENLLPRSSETIAKPGSKPIQSPKSPNQIRMEQIAHTMIQGASVAILNGGRPEQVWMAVGEGLGKGLGSVIGEKVVARAKEVRQERTQQKRMAIMAGVRSELIGFEASNPAQAKQPQASPSRSESSHSSQSSHPVPTRGQASSNSSGQHSFVSRQAPSGSSGQRPPASEQVPSDKQVRWHAPKPKVNVPRGKSGGLGLLSMLGIGDAQAETLGAGDESLFRTYQPERHKQFFAGRFLENEQQFKVGEPPSRPSPSTSSTRLKAAPAEFTRRFRDQRQAEIDHRAGMADALTLGVTKPYFNQAHRQSEHYHRGAEKGEALGQLGASAIALIPHPAAKASSFLYQAGLKNNQLSSSKVPLKLDPSKLGSHPKPQSQLQLGGPIAAASLAKPSGQPKSSSASMENLAARFQKVRAVSSELTGGSKPPGKAASAKESESPITHALNLRQKNGSSLRSSAQPMQARKTGSPIVERPTSSGVGSSSSRKVEPASNHRGGTPSRHRAKDDNSVGFSRKAEAILKNKGFQDHHIVSNKSSLTKKHEIFELSGVHINSRTNKMFLPSKPGLHPTRSIHNGGHQKVVSQALKQKLDDLVIYGKKNSWSREQFREGLIEIINREKSLLRSGERTLNRHKTERGRRHSF